MEKMTSLILYRKRIIPDECIELKDDIILSSHESYILTSWNALKPKKELHHGYSCYFLNEGVKVSKFYRKDHSLICWYCDIVDYHYDRKCNILISTDLLVDVLIYPDGFVKVDDLDELAAALEKQAITTDMLQLSLQTVSRLLKNIYSGGFGAYQQYINQVSPD